MPRDGHGLFRLVGHVGGGAEEPEGSVVVAEAGEEHDPCALLDMVLVAAAGGAVGAGGRLALPVDQLSADGVVPVPGGG